MLHTNPKTLEAQYVASTVGPALAKGLSEIVERRPNDPVEYLAHYLYKYVDNLKNQQKEKENAELIKQLQIEKEIEEKRQEEMKREAEVMRKHEEELRKEREAENRRKHELEELAKRKEEVANRAPPMTSLAEEEDQIVEFGETKLHEMAGTEGSNLTKMLKENFNVAARNKQSKTARDIAVEKNLTENVKQIDEFILELFAQENYKQLTDLLVLGFDDVIKIIENKHGNSDAMKQKGMNNQAEHIFTVFPQIQAKIRDLKNCIEKKDIETLKSSLDKKYLAYYRDRQGKSPLHHSIEKKHFEIALFLVEKFPVLSKLNDSFEKYPIDYLNQIDQSTLEDNDAVLYDHLADKLQ